MPREKSTAMAGAKSRGQGKSLQLALHQWGEVVSALRLNLGGLEVFPCPASKVPAVQQTRVNFY